MTDDVRDPANERWLPIPGYEGVYEVSDWGSVRSLGRIVRHGDSHDRIVYGQLLKQHLRKRGHRWVALMRPGQRMAHQLVHRAVLAAFTEPCPDGYECCHVDGNPANNRLENLYWGTHSENMQDALRHGTHSTASRTHCAQGHPFDAANTRRSKKNPNHRKCKACERIGREKRKALIQEAS